MDILDYVEPERWLEAEARQAVVVPAGCKGAACPFFAACQGRCAAKRRARAERVRARALAAV
jgi:radical SAM protein with 4Fe4S-binding SPASM domain